MSQEHEQINEAVSAIAEAKQSLTEQEHATSAARTAQEGWPVKLQDGTEMMAVKNVHSGAGPAHIIGADGCEYAPYRNNPANGWVKVGESLSPEEQDDVEATGTEPTPLTDEQVEQLAAAEAEAQAAVVTEETA